MRPTLVAAVLGVVSLVLDARPVSAVPVIYGSGDTVTFVSRLPEDSPARTKGQYVLGGNPDKVGFKHYQFHVFWMPLWTSTSEGQFVAYKENGFIRTWYQPLGTDPKEVSKKTGVPVSQLEIPWGARNPWGLYLLIGGLILYAGVNGVSNVVKRDSPQPLCRVCASPVAECATRCERCGADEPGRSIA